jgi:hypothetical protein
MGIHSLQGVIVTLSADERIVKIVKEEGQVSSSTQYTAAYRNPDQYLVITEIDTVYDDQD